MTVLFVIFLFVFFTFFSSWVTCMNLCLGFPEFFAINIHSAVWLMKELPRTGDWPWGCRGSHRVHLNSLLLSSPLLLPYFWVFINYMHTPSTVRNLFEPLRCEKSGYKVLGVYGLARIKQLIRAGFEFSILQCAASFTCTLTSGCDIRGDYCTF